jgi:hypothetical protein
MQEEDLQALRTAVAALEHPGLAARLAEIAGKPIELVGRALLSVFNPSSMCRRAGRGDLFAMLLPKIARFDSAAIQKSPRTTPN